MPYSPTWALLVGGLGAFTLLVVGLRGFLHPVIVGPAVGAFLALFLAELRAELKGRRYGS